MRLVGAPLKLCKACLWLNNPAPATYVCPFAKCTWALTSTTVIDGQIVERYIDRLTGKRVIVVTRKMVT